MIRTKLWFIGGIAGTIIPMYLFGLSGFVELVGVGAAAFAGASVGVALGLFAGVTGGLVGGFVGAVISIILPPYGIVAMSPFVAWGVKATVAGVISWLMALFMPH